MLLHLDFKNPEVASIFGTVICLYWFKALTVCCYSFLFRIDEVLSLEYRDIIIFKESNRNKMTIKLHERKTDNYEDAKFTLSEFPLEPCRNPIPFVDQYLKRMKELKKPQSSTNLLFPKITDKNIFSGTKGTCNDFTVLFKRALEYLGIFSTDMASHSLRKGGARHYFIYSSKLWNLDKITYWAGWSYVGDCKTIGIYLLEEHTKLKYNRIRDADDMMDRPVADIQFQNQIALEEIRSQVLDLFKIINPFINRTNEFLSTENFQQQRSFQNFPSPNNFVNFTHPVVFTNYLTQHQYNSVQMQPQPVFQRVVPITTPLGLPATSLPSQVNEHIENIELPTTIGTAEDVLELWNNGNTLLNVPPLCKWGKESRNRKSIKSRYSQYKNVVAFVNSVTQSGISSNKLEKYKKAPFGLARKLMYEWKKNLKSADLLIDEMRY